MSDQRPTSSGEETDLERPDEIRGKDDRRLDGRPSGEGQVDELRPAMPADQAPTEAPEERGGEPATEHAPGGDL